MTKQVEISVLNKNECQDQLDKIVPLINEAVSSMN
jgi:dynein heavy chain